MLQRHWHPVARLIQWLRRQLSRMTVAGVLMAVVVLLVAVGVCIPQVPQSASEDSARRAAWEASTRSRFGAAYDLLRALGGFTYFRSAPFLVPVAVLLAATLVCTLDRWRGIWRRVRQPDVVCSDSVFDSAPFRAQFAPGQLQSTEALQGSLERRGYRVRCRPMEVDTYLLGDRNRLSSLATFANHLALLLLLCGTLLTSWFSWRQELTLAPGEVADVGHGTGLGVSCEGFAISRYEDGSAAFYEASVRFLANGVTVGRGSVRLNEPLVRHGFRLYLRSYSGQEGAYTVTLLAAYDPGFAFVIMGGALLLLGLVVTFHLPYACLYARVTEGGAVLLAGRADRHDYGFAREFAALVAELGQDARGGQNAG